MAPRLELQSLLEDLCDNVYFQPPPNIKMKFPCIIYNRATAQTDFAGNLPYTYTKRYTITVVDRNPDSEIPDKVAKLPMCTHSRFYTDDLLNHDVFNLYF